MVDSVFQHRTIASAQCYTSIRTQKQTRIRHRAIINKSVINTRHHRFIAAGEIDCPQRKAWYTEESTRRTMDRWPTASSRSQLPSYICKTDDFNRNHILTNRTIHFRHFKIIYIYF
jgi:hypothetical protein